MIKERSFDPLVQPQVNLAVRSGVVELLKKGGSVYETIAKEPLRALFYERHSVSIIWGKSFPSQQPPAYFGEGKLVPIPFETQPFSEQVPYQLPRTKDFDFYAVRFVTITESGRYLVATQGIMNNEPQPYSSFITSIKSHIFTALQEPIHYLPNIE